MLMFESPSPRPAFMSDDPETILQFAIDAFDSGLGSAIVTLVDKNGGSSRPVGAQMAVRGDGAYCGYISGGCVEAAIAVDAMGAILENRDVRVVVGGAKGAFDLRLPCGGSITLLIHMVRETETLREILTCLERRIPACWVYDSGTQVAEFCPHDLLMLTGWFQSKFTRVYRPRPRLFLHGKGIETVATAKIAEASGYDVMVSQSWTRDRSKLPEIDRDSAIVLLFHDLDEEVRVLQSALHSIAFYIGALGSSRTHEKRCLMLSKQGYEDHVVARIRAPIGIVPNAKDASTLGLSVLAEIAAARCKMLTMV